MSLLLNNLESSESNIEINNIRNLSNDEQNINQPEFYTPRDAEYIEYTQQIPFMSLDGRYIKYEEIKSEPIYELPRDNKYLIPTSELIEILMPPYDTSIIDYNGMINIVNEFHNSIEKDIKYFGNKILNFNKFNTLISSIDINDIQYINMFISSIIGNMRQSLYANIDCKRSEYILLNNLSENNIFQGNIQHPTIKHKLITNRNNKGSIPITIKIIQDDEIYDFKQINNYKEQIIHEAAIGVALNSIVDKTPNFMYFYGLLPCDIQIDSDDIKQSNSCNDVEYPGYPVYEYIPGVSMEDIMRGNSSIKFEFVDIINILCQVLLSLAIASKEISFTHYNLNLKNIMILSYSQPIEVMYEYDNDILKWETRYLAKIIDYERAYAYIDNYKIHITNNFTGLEEYGYRAAPNHQYDIIKLITQEYNNEIEQLLMESISHLYIYNTPDVLIEDIDYSYILPKKEQNNYKYSAISVFDYFVYKLNLEIQYFKDSQIESSFIIPYKEIFDDIDNRDNTDNTDNKFSNICIDNSKDQMNLIKRELLSLLTITYNGKEINEALIEEYKFSVKNYLNELINNYNNIVEQYINNSQEGKKLIDMDKLYFSEFVERKYKFKNI